MYGKNIKRIRESRNMTQTELAERVGVTQEHISRLENEDRNPSFPLLEKIADSLKVPITDLLQDQIKEARTG
ncbi:helix-turn-helix domain-containing protein [Fodinisporobacter ferrooxydans]|uniref:Helix-turn-helix domain-containing protein n=1 Tax=Fodinisporobacter ferrooxydans TaxID=2901836 RepID=A0ABY4CKH5_9BACL|nr:helix-turn-helix domain-containing protein [Alicyclobacillaceae bacterium MYW30-H2]